MPVLNESAPARAVIFAEISPRLGCEQENVPERVFFDSFRG
ncbi:hypothetical protein [Leisingera sp. ANG59]|nr:hypothetical protein [Leisingera sp. ANG59]